MIVEKQSSHQLQHIKQTKHLLHLSHSEVLQALMEIPDKFRIHNFGLLKELKDLFWLGLRKLT